MKVLFDFSRSNLDNNLSAVEAIRSAILDKGYVLTNDLLEETKKRGVSLPNEVFTKIRKAISEADCVVIEGSTVSISLGYILTEALNLQKPVLFVSNSSVGVHKNRFLKSIETNLLTVSDYGSVKDIGDILNDFFEKFPLIKKRFNLVIDNKVDSFLTEKSRKKNISKTEYINELIKKDMALEAKH